MPEKISLKIFLGHGWTRKLLGNMCLLRRK